MNGVVTVGSLSAAPGERQHALLHVDVGPQTVDLPLVIVNGTRPGPRVAVTAGVHGGEYSSIPALRRLALSLEPTEVAGTLVAVLLANTAAFFARSVYYTPPDGLNLNRVFPGDSQGSPTERLASWLFDNVISLSDRYIDMHSGDLNEALVTFIGLVAPMAPDLDAAALAMAQAYGLDYILGPGESSPTPGPAVAAARAASIPAIWAEVAGRGSWTAEEVRQQEEGLRRALGAAGLLPNQDPTPPKASKRILHMASLRAEVSGCWFPAVEVGQEVVQGQVFGEIRDYFGEVLQTAIAPVAGMVPFLVTSLAVNASDPLGMVGY